jgi:hypothetical protein
VVFLAIEQKEPHAGQLAYTEVEQPSTYAGRQALAIRCRDELQIPFRILVDGMDDASRALFGDLPSPAFVIDAAGRVADKLPWTDPDRIAEILKELEGSAESRPAQPAGINETIALARARIAAKAYAEARLVIENAIRSARGLPPAVLAEAHLALATARRGEGDQEGAVASAALAEAMARKAWSSNPARLVAALCELAALEPPGPAAQSRWAAAIAALESRAPASQRAWIEARMTESGTMSETRPNR